MGGCQRLTLFCTVCTDGTLNNTSLCFVQDASDKLNVSDCDPFAVFQYGKILFVGVCVPAAPGSDITTSATRNVPLHCCDVTVLKAS